jgi:hypothetical protein
VRASAGKDVFRIAGEFHAAARRFTDALPRPVAETGTIPALFCQWLAPQGNGKAA